MTFLYLSLSINENWNMSQYSRKRIAKNVKFYRMQNSLKQEELSLILGFDNSYISKLERETVNITIDRLTKIADYFKIDVAKLLY